MSGFNTPVFLKNDSSLERKLDILKERYIYQNEEMINIEQGIKGEKQVAYHLNKSNIGMYILRDVNFKVDGMKAQVDYIVITSHHCYFIEAKNYSTNKVIVDENSNFIINVKNGDHWRRKGIESPLSQVDDQLSVFTRICLNNEEKCKELFKNNKFNDYFKTMVVFTNPDNIINVSNAPSSIKYRILKVDNLIRQIKYDNEHFDGIKMSQEEMKNIADYILSKNVEPKQNYNIQISNSPNSSLDKSKNNFQLLKLVGAVLMAYFIMAILVVNIGKAYYSNTTSSNSNYNNYTPSKVNKSIGITEGQKQSLDLLYESYNNTLNNGFDVINGETCKSISSIFGQEGFTCGKFPLEVNYKSENELTIYKDYKCYSLTIDDYSVSRNIENLITKGNDSCKGVPIGYANVDETNEYCQKIGGFNKIKEMAIYTYNHNASPTDYYSYDHVVERGGSNNLWALYYSYVNQYMCGVSGKAANSGCGYVGKEESDKMCEYLYYINK